MAYLKFSADQLFDGYDFVNGDPVLITDDDGTVIDIIEKKDAGDDWQYLAGTLAPGLINCHCHLELSHLKNIIPENTGLVDFLLRVMRERDFPEEVRLQAIEKAEDEMLRNGIVAVGDICNNDSTVVQKTNGRIYYHNFVEATGVNPATANDRFANSVDTFRKFGKNYSIAVESNSIVPHAPYSVSNELWEKIIHFPGNHLFTIHNQEAPEENEWFIHHTGNIEKLYKELKIEAAWLPATGVSSLQSYLPNFLNNQSVLFVHNVATSEADILFSKKTVVKDHLYWCLCPNANLYITQQLPDVNKLVKNECTIVLGTDSLASNHQLSILSEMKTINQHFPEIPLASLFKWATSNGAKALQMDSLLGSFDKGKKPGIVLIGTGMDTIKRVI